MNKEHKLGPYGEQFIHKCQDNISIYVTHKDIVDKNTI